MPGVLYVGGWFCQDVQAMKENVTNRAKEQFEAANQQYWQLDADYRNAKVRVVIPQADDNDG